MAYPLFFSIASKNILMLVKPFLCWLGKAFRAPGVSDSQNSRTSAAHGGVKVVTPTFQLPLLPRIYSRYSFLLNVSTD